MSVDPTTHGQSGHQTVVQNDQELEAQIRQQMDGISPKRQAFDRWFLGAAITACAWVLRRWLLIANLFNGLTLAGALVVPLLWAAGLDWLANPLFAAYHLICEQRPERSYFLWGYQMAMDQRMTAIYGSSLVAGLAYLPLRDRLPPISWRAFLLLCLPIAADGFTQFFGWRISSWELRTITGALFGVATVWLAYPRIDSSLEMGPTGPRPPVVPMQKGP